MNPVLLCPLLQEYLEAVTKLSETLDDDLTVSVSAYPDIVLVRCDGHWAGIDHKQDMPWIVWRGSMLEVQDHRMLRVIERLNLITSERIAAAGLES